MSYTRYAPSPKYTNFSTTICDYTKKAINCMQ